MIDTSLMSNEQLAQEVARRRIIPDLAVDGEANDPRVAAAREAGRRMGPAVALNDQMVSGGAGQAPETFEEESSRVLGSEYAKRPAQDNSVELEIRVVREQIKALTDYLQTLESGSVVSTERPAPGKPSPVQLEQ